jgi:uncharacterized cofD-like protein
MVVRKKKIVVIGGGTGTYQTLVGLKKYPVELCAVVAMSDSGGSTGRLRKELSILPPGDIRRALLALSNLPLSKKTLEHLFDFRFETGEGLAGHSVGNLLLAALTQITGRMDLAIAEAAKILEVSGYVYPVTLDHTNLVAVLENGQRIFGEAEIDLRAEKTNGSLSPIKRIYLSPSATVFPAAAYVIKKADAIVLAPGDLYTSLIPNLLVNGVTEAIEKSKAKVILVVNLMTKPGETDGYCASHFVKVVKDYLGSAKDRLSHILINKPDTFEKKTLSWYKKFGQVPVKDDLERRVNGIRIVRGNFVQKSKKAGLLRHDPAKLARAIMRIL